MDLKLDGASTSMDTSSCANLAELVSAAENFEAASESFVVVSVEVDGQELAPEELAQLETRPLVGLEHVSIQRRPTRVVAQSVLAQGGEYAERIALAIDQCVDEFRAARSDRANQTLADISDSLTVLSGISSSVATVLPDTAQALEEVQQDIFPWLQELVAAQGEQDPLGIADLLEYEIRPRVESWGKIMGHCAED